MDKTCLGNKIDACSIQYNTDPHQLSNYFNEITYVEKEDYETVPGYVEELTEIAKEVSHILKVA